MQGFTRTVYEDGYKHVMVYPPGWKQGDKRQPKVHKEPHAPDAFSMCITEDPLERVDIPDQRPCDTTTSGTWSRPAATREDTGLETQQWEKSASSSSYPLKVYLSQLWSPKYKGGPQVNLSVRHRDGWPIIRELVQPPGSRKLYLVQRIYERDLYRAFVVFLGKMPDVQITPELAEQGRLFDLSLPDTACRLLDTHDAFFIDGSPISTPSDVTKFLRTYPLRTIIKIGKLFKEVPDGHEVCKRLRFDDVNYLCPVRNPGLFDLIALPSFGTNVDELTFRLLMVVGTPWDVKHDDLEEFTRLGVPDKGLDLCDKPSPSPANVLRAVIWDMCLKHNCPYFILTTYDEWVFGTFSSDMHRMRVTTHLRAPVFPRDMTVSYKDISQQCSPDPSVFECLLLWFFAAADDRKWWDIPPDLPAPLPARGQNSRV